MLSDAWYVTSIAGLRAGTLRETVEATSDTTLLTRTVTRIEVRRFGDRVQLEETDEWRETTDGRPLEYRSTREMAEGERILLQAVVRRDSLLVYKESGGEEYRSRLALRSPLTFPRALSRLHASHGFVAGDRYSYVTFDPDFELPTECDVKVDGIDTMSVAGTEVALFHVQVVSDLYDGIVIDEWRDSTGDLWVQRFPSLGMETRRATAEEATREVTPPDLAEATLIETNTTIQRPDLVDEALYAIRLHGDYADGVLPSDERQAVEGRSDQGTLLRVRRIDPGPGAPPMADAAREFAPYLQGNAILQKGDPRVLDAAEDAVSGARDDSWKMAVAISDWVALAIRDRGYGTAFASASQVLAEGSGDCSEHAVLAAAMARAVGVPSRLATGVVHFRGAFAYHMWIEVWTGDGWHALDPTAGGAAIDATHILLGVSALENGSVGELAVPVLRTANALGITVVEYVESGKRTTPAGGS